MPLNAAIVIVFSQPLDSASIDSNTIHLELNGVTVPARLFVPPTSPWEVEVVPDTLLAPETIYRLVVTSDVRDASGEALQEPLDLTFTSGADENGLAGLFISPQPFGLAIGFSQALTLIEFDAASHQIQTPDTAHWSSATTAIATVDQHGVVTATGNGTTVIRACIRAICDSATVYVTPPATGTAPMDLGTLGGVNSAAAAINESGTVVGWAETPTGDMHAFRWTRERGMEDLGTLGGLPTSYALAINDSGVVIGLSERPDGLRHLFRWTPGVGMEDMTVTLALPDNIGICGINNLGEIAWLEWTNPGRYATVYIWSKDRGTSSHKAPRPIEGGVFPSECIGLNNQSEIGINVHEKTYDWPSMAAIVDARSGVVQRMFYSGGYDYQPSYALYAISDRGLAAWNTDNINYQPPRFAIVRSFLGLSDETMPAIGQFTQVSINGMNRLGDAIGNAAVGAGVAPLQPFLWAESGPITYLGSLGGQNNSAYAINSARQIAGASTIGSGSAAGARRAVLWDLSGLSVMRSFSVTRSPRQ